MHSRGFQYFESARLLLVAMALAAVASGCEFDRSAPAPVAATRPAVTPGPPLPTAIAAAKHVVAIGDLHGDVGAARAALKLAGAIDDADQWSGGALVVVQLGDQIDRADDDRAVLDLFETLMPKAKAAGGGLYPLLGNHEIMVARGDVRYVTPGAFARFSSLAPNAVDDDLALFPPAQRGHRAAFRPGGPYAQKLARRNLAMRVGKTLFVHGGLLPHHKPALSKMNDDVRQWLLGNAPLPPHFGEGPEDRPVWSRRFSFETDAEDCAVLDATLAAFEATRLVVAHTVQPQGISSACGGKVWRVDSGMSRAYGGPVQVLAIDDDVPQIKRAPPRAR